MITFALLVIISSASLLVGCYRLYFAYLAYRENNRRFTQIVNNYGFTLSRLPDPSARSLKSIFSLQGA